MELRYNVSMFFASSLSLFLFLIVLFFTRRSVFLSPFYFYWGLQMLTWIGSWQLLGSEKNRDGISQP